MLPTRAKEPAIKVVLIIGRAPTTVAEAPLVIVFVIRNVHFFDSPLSLFFTFLAASQWLFTVQLCICSPLKLAFKEGACARYKGDQSCRLPCCQPLLNRESPFHKRLLQWWGNASRMTVAAFSILRIVIHIAVKLKQLGIYSEPVTATITRIKRDRAVLAYRAYLHCATIQRSCR